MVESSNPFAWGKLYDHNDYAWIGVFHCVYVHWGSDHSFYLPTLQSFEKQ